MNNLVEIHRDPTSRQLRQFGILSALLLPTVGWVWDLGAVGLMATALAGLLLALCSYLRPSWIKPVFVGMMLVTAPIGMLVGEIAMLVIYFGLFLPIGLFLRMLGRDSLHLKFDKNATSYWRVKDEPTKMSRYFRRY